MVSGYLHDIAATDRDPSIIDSSDSRHFHTSVGLSRVCQNHNSNLYTIVSQFSADLMSARRLCPAIHWGSLLSCVSHGQHQQRAKELRCFKYLGI